jgi:hypothetical protein
VIYITDGFFNLLIIEVKKEVQGGTFMNKENERKNQLITDDKESLKGTLFATIVFVGGAIVLWTLVLLLLFIMRF